MAKVSVKVFDSSNSAAKYAAWALIEVIEKNPNKAICLPTGSTPKEVYLYLRQYAEKHPEFLLQTTTFNLDEYVGEGYGPEDSCEGSYHHYMEAHLFSTVQVAACYIPDGSADNLGQTCTDYEEWITNDGGFIFVLLGIGENGHVGFNEPGSAQNSITSVVDLAPRTIETNTQHFDDGEIPPQAITMGIGTILKNAHGIIMLLAFGEKKAEAIRDMLEGPINETCPASFLRKYEGELVIVADNPAIALLEEDGDYEIEYMDAA